MPLIKQIKINWLTTKRCLELSSGEIKNDKTINPRTLKPELGGLFCPRIFGPYRDYECYCGKYKVNPNDPQQKQNIGKECEECGVLIAEKVLQRWRMGHIRLVSPVTNIILFKYMSPFLSKILGISSKKLEEIIYLENYVVIDVGLSRIAKKRTILQKDINRDWLGSILEEIITSQDMKSSVIKKAQQLKQDLINEKNNKTSAGIIFISDYIDFLEKKWQMKIRTGSEAFLDLLNQLDLVKELEELEKKPKENLKEADKEKIKVLRGLLKQGIDIKSMVTDHLLVIACGLRPALKVKGNASGVIATTLINQLYRLLILSNNRLEYLIESSKKMSVFISDIIDNQKKRLQQTFDNLIYKDQGKRNSVKSIAQNLEGKDGLRSYSLGKRMNFSGRVVIAPGPELPYDKVGVPVKMLLALYKPFVLSSLLKKEIALTLKEGEELIKNHDLRIFPILLEEIIPNHPILFNRQPSLHRPSLMSSYPVPNLGNDAKMHTLINFGLNLDHDGDQMPFFLPTTQNEIKEAKSFMLPSNNLLDPKNGQLIAIPTKEIILGVYHLTFEKKNPKLLFYFSLNDILRSYEKGQITLQDLIVVPFSLAKKLSSQDKNKFLFTTLGKIIINQIFPPSFSFYLNDLKYYNQNQTSPDSHDIFSLCNEVEINELWKNREVKYSGWKKKEIIDLLNYLAKTTESSEMTEFLDKLKDLGFRFATESGISISLFELPFSEVSKEKNKLLLRAQNEVQQVDDHLTQGFYSDDEAKERKIEIWSKYKDDVEKKIVKDLEERKETSLYKILDSGAKMNSENLTQIFATGGNVVDFKGRIIENPIISSLKEGLSHFEFSNSTRGAAKGMFELSIKTAEAGDFTRQLVEVAQEIVITEEDCLTEDADFVNLVIKKSEETEVDFVPFYKVIYGHYLARDIISNEKKILINRGTILLDGEIIIIQENKIDNVWIRSSFYCSLNLGICQKCYGLINLFFSDVSKDKVIKLGTAIGIIAAQSLGEPGTQLTMRTFHTGGVSSGDGKEDIIKGLPKIKAIFNNSPLLKKAILAKIDGKIISVEAGKDKESLTTIRQKGENKEISYSFADKIVKVNLGQIVKKGEKITSGEIDLNDYLEIMGRDICKNYIIKEIWKVYYEQGIDINQRHIELFVRQMLSRVEITNAGESNYLIGETIDYFEFHRKRKTLIEKKKKALEAKNILLGLKQVIKNSPSVLASITYRNALKSLVEYSLKEPDYLRGPKESFIAGQLVPVGEGFFERRKMIEKNFEKTKKSQ